MTNRASDIFIVTLAFCLGLTIGQAYFQPDVEPEKSRSNSSPIISASCDMDEALLSRLESDLIAAHQIAWDWISVEAQCTCNSPWKVIEKE